MRESSWPCRGVWHVRADVEVGEARLHGPAGQFLSLSLLKSVAGNKLSPLFLHLLSLSHSAPTQSTPRANGRFLPEKHRNSAIRSS